MASRMTRVRTALAIAFTAWLLSPIGIVAAGIADALEEIDTGTVSGDVARMLVQLGHDGGLHLTSEQVRWVWHYYAVNDALPNPQWPALALCALLCWWLADRYRRRTRRAKVITAAAR